MSEVKVLGIDLACRSWSDIGTAVTTLRGTPLTWHHCQINAIQWPDAPISSDQLATVILDFVMAKGISAVSIDGPQGWRSPEAGNRPGVGRACEFEAGTPGKTGRYDQTFPGNYQNWVRFSIDLFERLMASDRSILINAREQTIPLAKPKDGAFYLIECFPTSTWRSCGLNPLPGHKNAPPNVVLGFAGELCHHLGLPEGAITDHHDHLQAVVASLPGAALLGGPCGPIPRGEPGWQLTGTANAPAHWVEGLIWDAMLPNRSDTPSFILNQVKPVAPTLAENRPFHDVTSNPLLPDNRDVQGEVVIERGTKLFSYLAQLANAGQCVGISYSDFVCHLYDANSFVVVAGRKYRPSDSAHVIHLAMIITEEAGGRKTVCRNGVTIQAGMDTFIWPSRPPHLRHPNAWTDKDHPLPYTKSEWLRIFPDGSRSLHPGRGSYPVS